MRFSTTINNIKAVEWDLSIQEAYLFAWFYELPSWADKVQMEGETFYFASKNKAVEELPILTEKVDTMYRYYKTLTEKDLIILKKVDGKDFIALTKKAKAWNLSVGNKSEYSEINPTKLGKKSENNSEKNPTYNSTSINNINKDNINTVEPENQVPSFVEADRERAREAVKEMKSAGIIPIAELKEQLKSDTASCELYCINHKLTIPQVMAAIDNFSNYLLMVGEDYTRTRFRSHFANWLPKNLDKVQPQQKSKRQMVY